HITANVWSARPDPTGLIRPRGTRDNDSAFPGGSDWLHDSTCRDLAMVDISREGNEQLAGERDDRDAAGPAALGADALAEPTARSKSRMSIVAQVAAIAASIKEWGCGG